MFFLCTSWFLIQRILFRTPLEKFLFQDEWKTTQIFLKQRKICNKIQKRNCGLHRWAKCTQLKLGRLCSLPKILLRKVAAPCLKEHFSSSICLCSSRCFACTKREGVSLLLRGCVIARAKCCVFFPPKFLYSVSGRDSQMYLRLLPQFVASRPKEQFLGAFQVMEKQFLSNISSL